MALFTTFRMQKDDNIRFKSGFLEQGNLQKVVSNGWCKESRIVMHANSKRFIHTLPTDKFFDLE